VAGTRELRDLARPKATLRELAATAGVSLSLVYKVAAGKRRPNVALRRAVEEVFGAPASVVFGDEVARPVRGRRNHEPS
jgi:transcriptional regulator with XRE-family HTH domain